MLKVQFLSKSFSILFLALAGLAVAAPTRVIFNPQSLTGGPFPNDSLVVPDSSQITGVRVNLPASEDACSLASSAVVCSNRALLNTLDGFSLNPRLMVCFSGPINPQTLQAGIFLVPVTSPQTTIGINQIYYDPTANCAYAKPSHVLAQDTTYALAVMNTITDANGKAVVGDPSFQSIVLKAAGVNPPGIVGGSIFTTMSATAWAQAAHAVADAAPASVCGAGSSYIFKISDLTSLTWNTPSSAAPTSQPIPLSVLGGVGEIAFGLFESPNFLNPASGTIDYGSSKKPIAQQFGTVPVSFHVLLPATPAPSGGYPVLLWGHGLGDNQFGASTYLASTFAKNGFAILTIEVTGQGFGADSTVTATTKENQVYTESTPGRGVALGGPGTPIGPTDGCIIAGTPIGTRDCDLQTAADLSAIVHAIRTTGVLGLPLNPNAIYYGGQSEGSLFGTVFNAVEPNIQAAVLSVGGGTAVDIARTSITGRPLAILYAEQYGLLNVETDGAPPEPYFNDPFNDNYVFPNQAPVVNDVPGATAVQAGFEAADWLQMIGDPLSYAVHLKAQPLPGNSAKPVLFLYSQGDLDVPNPSNSALIQAAGIQSTSWYLNFQKVYNEIDGQQTCAMPCNPHTLFSYPTMFQVAWQQSIGLAEQQQAATFLSTNGKQNPNPNTLLTPPFKGQQLFEIPPTLPETLNYFQLPTSFQD